MMGEISKADAGWALFFVLAAAFLAASFGGCSHPVNSAQLRWQLSALEELPDDPGEVNGNHVVMVVERLRGSRAVDAGAQ